MMNRISIEVFGAEYPITSSESPQYVKALGQEIDDGVKSIIHSSAASLPQSLVLLCLSYLDSYKKAEKGADHLRNQVAEYLQEASTAKRELAEAKAKLERFNRDHQLSIDEA